MKRITFDCYTDPGHGWVKVAKELLHKLGIATEITSYSYMKGDYAYLEEDCDATTLCNTLKDKGVEFHFRQHYSNRSSKIRSYFPYRYTLNGFPRYTLDIRIRI